MKESDLIDLAHKMAERSPVRRFQTGAVLFKNGKVLSSGWSHASDRNMTCYRSMHAELHALSRCDSRDAVGSSIAIVTLSRKSGNRTDGTPCFFCLRNLKKVGIEKIICTSSGGGTKSIYLAPIDIVSISETIDVGAKKPYVNNILEYAG